MFVQFFFSPCILFLLSPQRSFRGCHLFWQQPQRVWQARTSTFLTMPLFSPIVNTFSPSFQIALRFLMNNIKNYNGIAELVLPLHGAWLHDERHFTVSGSMFLILLISGHLGMRYFRQPSNGDPLPGSYFFELQ
jgi:hypothetical protein